MRRVWTKNAREGQILALPVTNKRGVTVVQKGSRLTSMMIERLKQHGVQRIFIDDPAFEGVDCQEGLDSVTFSELEGFLERLATAARGEGWVDLSSFSRELYTWSERVCAEMERGPASFLLYPNEGDVLHRWIAHSVNVALLAARSLLNIGGRDQARYMIAAAFLMDLGLWKIDEQAHLDYYLKGETPASPFSRHVDVSIRLVHTIPGLPSYVKAVVAQHHERSDGSGYPKGLAGDAIHPLARVMGVVDSFVAQTQRDHDPLLPHDALEWLMAGVGFEFDQTAVKVFRNAAHPYPVGMEVELDSGEQGVVTGVRGSLLVRPTVRVVRDAQGREVSPYYEVDLAAQTTKSIRRIL